MRLFRREQLTEEEQQRRSALKEAKNKLKEAEKVHNTRVKEARKRLSETERDYQRRVGEARNTLENKRQSKKLGSMAGVTLYDDKIATPDGTSTLSPDVRADADTAGNLQVSGRVTATRLVTLGVFAFAFKKKKTHDARELYLVIETPDFMSVRQLDPKLGNTAKQFAARIVNAGKQAQHVMKQKAEMAEIAEHIGRTAGQGSDRRRIWHQNHEP
jgi:hypothetical protein